MYYLIDSDDNPKIVGSDYPQSWKFTPEYKKKCQNANAVYAFCKYIDAFKRPDFTPDLGGLVLSRRAKLTDIVSTTVFTGLFMNKSAKDIFSNCNLGDYEFYKAQLFTKSDVIDYYYLFQFTNVLNFVDFSKTIIKYNIYYPQRQTIQINGFDSFAAYQEFHNKTLEVIVPTKISFKAGIDRALDYMLIPYLSVFEGIASENLKSKIESAGITGIKFVPIEIVFE